jgi:hypothetical protein
MKVSTASTAIVPEFVVFAESEQLLTPLSTSPMVVACVVVLVVVVRVVATCVVVIVAVVTVVVVAVMVAKVAVVVAVIVVVVTDGVLVVVMTVEVEVARQLEVITRSLFPLQATATNRPLLNVTLNHSLSTEEA